MTEHGHEDKIAEETQQVTKALIHKSEEYRKRLIDNRIFDAMVYVMQVNPRDRGAIDLTCENLAWLVGPCQTNGPIGNSVSEKKFVGDFQLKALKAGALTEVMKVFTNAQKMEHKEHGAFNFDVDMAYNVNRECFEALAKLGHENPKAQEIMRDAGIATVVTDDFAKRPNDVNEIGYGLELMNEIGAFR